MAAAAFVELAEAVAALASAPVVVVAAVASAVLHIRVALEPAGAAVLCTGAADTQRPQEPAVASEEVENTASGLELSAVLMPLEEHGKGSVQAESAAVSGLVAPEPGLVHLRFRLLHRHQKSRRRLHP